MGNKRHRTLSDWLYGCYVWMLFGVTILLFGGVALVLRTPVRTRPVARHAARLLFRLARMPLSVRGLEYLPDRPHMLLVNHTSFLDGIVLTALLPAGPGYAFAVRQQYRSQALLWPLLKALGTIVLTHAAPQHRSANIARLAAHLRNGQNLILFPEGGVRPEPGLQPFHSGAFVAAAASGAPIVVAGLHGARDALRLGTWLPRRSALHLEIGPALAPTGNDPVALLRVNQAARDAMQPLTGEDAS